LPLSGGEAEDPLDLRADVIPPAGLTEPGHVGDRRDAFEEPPVVHGAPHRPSSLGARGTPRRRRLGARIGVPGRGPSRLHDHASLPMNFSERVIGWTETPVQFPPASLAG